MGQLKVLDQHDEVLHVKSVICEGCGKETIEGMAYHCLYPMGDGTLSHVVKYMCLDCISKGRPIPGFKPQTGVPKREIYLDKEKNRRRHIT